jgi:hypothetical protein
MNSNESRHQAIPFSDREEGREKVQTQSLTGTGQGDGQGTGGEAEKWAEIADYEGLYQVSSFGRVRSMQRVQPHGCYGAQRHLKERLLKLQTSTYGYYYVSLSKLGRVKKVTVHVLVCSAFHSRPVNAECVNHKNGVKKDNRPINLEWTTYSANNQHAFDTGLKQRESGLNGEKIGTSKLTAENVRYIRSNIITKPKIKGNAKLLADMFKVSVSAILRAARKEYWKSI